jgi:hypothetical protein
VVSMTDPYGRILDFLDRTGRIKSTKKFSKFTVNRTCDLPPLPNSNITTTLNYTFTEKLLYLKNEL